MSVRSDKEELESAGGAAAGAGPAGRPTGSRAPLFIRRSPALHTSWRVIVFLAGLAVVGLGIVMLPMPGPGWVVIFLGMSIWATEFAWAQRVLRWTRRKVAEAAHRAMDPKVRRRNLAITAVVLVLIAAAAAWYLRRYGLALPW
ncbi:TIGR02611 family protein [Kitasatospora sp. NPDC088346]|uniref:TIGR02611 family protein n=1 Tax=Kitasatospora sp. NPDC088346 TaxID=3364073 RepID=UPI0038242CD2